MCILLWGLLLTAPRHSHGEEALIAVATNFVPALEQLLPRFRASEAHQIRIAGGSTGKLYAQILRGAPYDAFLAADQERPQLLEESELGVKGSRFTYAHGRLALWSADPLMIGEDGVAVLRAAKFHRLAIANTRTAPYGSAAKQVLEGLGLYESLRSRLVMGDNVGQAFAFVATGSAEIGLVALSSVLQRSSGQSWWVVPKRLHAPIAQDAVLLAHGRSNLAAITLLKYLKRRDVQYRLASLGYVE